MIELSDSSYELSARKKRDEFLRDVCCAANLPLIQVDAKRAYSIKEIRSIFAQFLPENIPFDRTVDIENVFQVGE